MKGNLSSESLIETETSIREQTPPENILIFRIIVVGAKGVGKTSIVKQFTERKWVDEIEPDRGIEYRPCYRFYNERQDFVKFLMVDCPCYDVVRFYNSGYMRGIIGSVIVFNLADRSTLNEAKNWYEQLKDTNQRNPKFIQVLLGHQKD
jgi:GTPase SAR1 family protein